MPDRRDLPALVNPLATYFVTGPIIDMGQGVNVSPACFLMNRAVGTGDTALAHSLGRIPNGYKMIRASVAGTLYDASTGVTAWTASSISVRATVAGTYSLEII